MKVQRFIVGLAAVTAALCLAPAAHADNVLTTTEQQFADGTWQATCRYLDATGVNRASMTELIKVMYPHAPGDLGDTVDIINYTVSTYCPRHWPALVAFGEGARA